MKNRAGTPLGLSEGSPANPKVLIFIESAELCFEPCRCDANHLVHPTLTWTLVQVNRLTRRFFNPFRPSGGGKEGSRVGGTASRMVHLGSANCASEESRNSHRPCRRNHYVPQEETSGRWRQQGRPLQGPGCAKTLNLIVWAPLQPSTVQRGPHPGRWRRCRTEDGGGRGAGPGERCRVAGPRRSAGGSRANLSTQGVCVAFRRASPFAPPAIKSTAATAREPTQAFSCRYFSKDLIRTLDLNECSCNGCHSTVIHLTTRCN